MNLNIKLDLEVGILLVAHQKSIRTSIFGRSHNGIALNFICRLAALNRPSGKIFPVKEGNPTRLISKGAGVKSKHCGQCRAKRNFNHKFLLVSGRESHRADDYAHFLKILHRLLRHPPHLTPSGAFALERPIAQIFVCLLRQCKKSLELLRPFFREILLLGNIGL